MALSAAALASGAATLARLLNSEARPAEQAAALAARLAAAAFASRAGSASRDGSGSRRLGRSLGQAREGKSRTA